MKPEAQKIMDAVSTLSPMDRAEIIEKIIETFDVEPDEELKKAWADEAKRRLDSYYRGESKTMSEEEVFNRIEKECSK